MEYQRIEKVQTGILSPSKLRMKLMGLRKKEGSPCKSSRTSPSKVEDSEFVNNILLLSNGDFNEEASNLDHLTVRLPDMEVGSTNGLDDQTATHPKENGNTGRVKTQQFSKGGDNNNNNNGNSSAIHPMRNLEDDNLDYDSNASSSSFEFHKGEKSVQISLTRSFSRPMSSKWNDAEKWIMNRHNSQTNKKTVVTHNQVNRSGGTNIVRVAPDYSTSSDYNKSMMSRVADTKRMDFCQLVAQVPVPVQSEKFSFVPGGTQPFPGQALIDQCIHNKDLRDVDQRGLSSTRSSIEDNAGVLAIRSVCMRDMGTEMTPIPSQEPSTTSTPIGATTPFRSPTSSLPSTPRRRAESAPTDVITHDESSNRSREVGKKELSDEEMKMKTRKEIVALGVQLGKMNIAAWASKAEQEKKTTTSTFSDETTSQIEKIEFEKRAAAWEEAEKTKHTARFMREEVKIQAWESRQKAKLEADFRRIEAKAEEMRVRAEAKMAKKVAMTTQTAEEKRVAAEARKNQDAEIATTQAGHIRQSGKMPRSPYVCCGWSWNRI